MLRGYVRVMVYVEGYVRIMVYVKGVCQDDCVC